MNFKTTIVLLVLASAGGLLLFFGPGLFSWLALTPQKPATGDAGTLGVLEADFTPDRLTRIEVHHGADEVVLERSPGGEWSLPGKWPTRKPEVDDLVRRVCTLRSRFAPIPVGDVQPDLKVALDHPTITLKIQANGIDHTILLAEEPGDTNRFSRATYLRLDDKPEVVRLAPGLAAALARPQDYYQQRRLFPEERVVKEKQADFQEKVEQLSAKALTAKNKSGTFTLARAGNNWELRAPVHDRADPDKLKSILIAVPDIWAEQFVEHPKKDVAEYGLKDPEETILVTRPSGDTVALLIGKQSQVKTRTVMRPAPNLGGGQPDLPPQKEIIHDEYRFAKLQDNAQVFEIKADKLKDVFVAANTLRDARLARFRTEDVRRVEISQAGQVIALVKEKDQWRLHKPFEGEAESSKITELLDKLSGLQALDKDILDKADPKSYGLDKPNATVTVTVEEETKGEGDAKTKKTKTFSFALGKDDLEKSKLYVQVAGWERINAVEDNLLKLVQRPALVYRGRRVLDFNGTDLAKLEVNRGGKPFTLEQVKGSWRLAAPFQADTDSSKASQLAGDLGRLEAVEFVAQSASPQDLEKLYGLAKPELSVTATFADAKKPGQTLLIGKSRAGKSEYFAKLASAPSVFVIKKDIHDALEKDALAYLPEQLWQLQPDDIKELRLRKNGQEYRLQRSGENWKIAGPFDASAVASLVKPMTEEVANLRCERFAAHSTTDLGAYGLDKPYLRLALVATEKDKAKPGQQPEKERALLIGKPVDKTSKSRFAKLADSPTVGVIGEKVVAALDHDALDLLDRDLLSLDPQNIERIQSASPKGKLTLARQGDGWRVLDTPAAPFAADSEAIASVLGVWSNLRAQRIAAYGPQANPASYGLEKPIDTITVTLKSPSGKSTKPVEHTLALGKPVEGSSGDRYARLDNGPAVIVLAANQVNNSTRGYLDFVNRDVLKFDGAHLASLARLMGNDNLEITKTDGSWRILKPTALPADGPTLNGLTEQLAALRAKRVAAYPAQDLKPFGLDQPAAVITLRTTGTKDKPAEHVLKIGKVTGEAASPEDRFALTDHADTVVVLPGGLARQLTAPDLQYRDRNLASLRDVDRLTLERGPRSAVFTKVDGAWKQLEPVAGEAEQADLDDFVNNISKLHADELVSVKPADLKSYGLDRPVARWRFLVGGKEVLNLFVGENERGKGNQGARAFAKLASGDLVFLLSPESTSKALGEYRKRTVWAALDAAQIDSLGYGYLDHPFALEKKGEANWQVAGKPDVKVKAEIIRDALDALAGLKAERYVVDKTADLKLYGLEPPQLSLEIQTRSGKRLLQIGRPEGESKRYYARAPEGDGSAVFIISEADAHRIVKPLAGFTQETTKAALPSR